MNPRTFRLLWLVVLALGAYIAFFESGWKPFERPVPPPAVVFPELSAAQVASVDLVLQSNRVIRVERTNGAWQLTLPIRYPAQAARIDRLVQDLARLRPQGTLTAREWMSQPRGRASFGLESPARRLVLSQGGRRFELQLGDRVFGSRQCYAQRVGSDSMLILDASLLEQLPSQADDWRSRDLVPEAVGTFTRLSLRSGALGYELERNPTNQQWQLVKPMPMRANHPRVENLVRLLQNAQVTAFVADPPVLDGEAYGLQPARAEVTLLAGTNVAASWRLGATPTNQPGSVYAQLWPFNNVVLIPKPAADILALPYKELLDPRLVTFQAAAVGRIEVQARETFSLTRQADGSWQVAPQGFAADTNAVADMLERLNRLEILEVEKDVVTELDFPKYGLAPPDRQYLLQSVAAGPAGAASNAPLAQIQFGTNQNGRLFVRRADETPVYVTRAQDALALPQTAFQLRDRHVWSFATNQVVGVTWTVKGQTTRLVRQPQGGWAAVSGPTQDVPLALNEMLFRLGQLRAEVWVAQGAEPVARLGFADAAHQLTLDLLVDGRALSLSLELGRQSPLLTPYAAITLGAGGERAAFAFGFWFYEPYREVLRDLNLPAPDRGP
jgi:hypothetical protein